jgi:hypothetical protein
MKILGVALLSFNLSIPTAKGRVITKASPLSDWILIWKQGL